MSDGARCFGNQTAPRDAAGEEADAVGEAADATVRFFRRCVELLRFWLPHNQGELTHREKMPVVRDEDGKIDVGGVLKLFADPKFTHDQKRFLKRLNVSFIRAERAPKKAKTEEGEDDSGLTNEM